MTAQTERERELLDQIMARVKEIGDLRAVREEFVPGESPVRYAGRVYDHREMVALVESALEFWLTAGRWHATLERKLAAWYGVRAALLTNSGSSANLLAAAALMSPALGDARLRIGDEVVTVAAGFPTTIAPLVQLGLVPVFVDIALPSYNIDVSMLEEAISPRTRAVFVAHTLGNPFDVETVKDFCTRHGLFLVEDNCDAAGSLVSGRKTGTFGDLATLSFYPAHHMTTGEGGAVLCSSPKWEKIVASLRDWGRDCWCQPGVDNTCGKRFGWTLGQLPCGYDHKYTYSHLGFNLKMTDLQAAVGVVQLDKLDEFCERRRANWLMMRRALEPLADVLLLPEADSRTNPSWFGFIMTVRETASFTRDMLVRHLETQKIQTRMLFAGNMTRQPALIDIAGRRGFRIAGTLERTDFVMSNSFWLGVYPGLTESMISYVIKTIQDFVLSARVR